MDLNSDIDHVMGDDSILASTEANGLATTTLDPAQIAYKVASGNMSVSPEIPRAVVIDVDGANGSFNAENEHAKRIIKRDVSTAPKFLPLPYSTSRTGLVYDVRMRFHVEPIPKDHNMHPEDPRRIFAVYDELVQAGLVDDPTSPDLVGSYVLLRIPLRPAIREEILACHSERSFNWVMDLESTFAMMCPPTLQLTCYRLG